MPDDFPEHSWIEVRVPAGDVPRSVRLRHWLKLALRTYGIRVVRVTGRVAVPEPDYADLVAESDAQVERANQIIAEAQGDGPECDRPGDAATGNPGAREPR